MVWAVNRLGRSLVDLIGSLNELHGAKVDLFLHQQAIDTTTPAGRALFGMLGVFAEFERSMIVSRINAGIARVKETGKTKTGRGPRRPPPRASHGQRRQLLARAAGCRSSARLSRPANRARHACRSPCASSGLLSAWPEMPFAADHPRPAAVGHARRRRETAHGSRATLEPGRRRTIPPFWLHTGDAGSDQLRHHGRLLGRT